MFIETLRDNLLIGPRCYPRGSVVEVDDHRGGSEVAAGVARPHPGPASEPAPNPVPPEPRARRAPRRG